MGHQTGTVDGYRPEFKDPLTEKWKAIHFKNEHVVHGGIVAGIPYPALCGGVLQEVYLCGHAQAQTLAWGFAANYEAVHAVSIEVRIVRYKVKYTIEYEPAETNDKVEENV